MNAPNQNVAHLIPVGICSAENMRTFMSSGSVDLENNCMNSRVQTADLCYPCASCLAAANESQR